MLPLPASSRVALELANEMEPTLALPLKWMAYDPFPEMTAVSAAPGTALGDQLVPAFQMPPAVLVQVMVAAETGRAQARQTQTSTTIRAKAAFSKESGNDRRS